MPDRHALLSPSASERWLHCTAAPRLEEHFHDEATDYTKEGTLAHAYCALGLKTYLGQDASHEEREISELSDYISDEMNGYVKGYIDYVTGIYAKEKKATPDALLDVESELDLSKWIPEGFGTSDAVIIADGTMHVIDFKYGKGVKVDAVGNTQMRIYALGALEKYAFEYDIRCIVMTIYQPRMANVSSDVVTPEELLRWGQEVVVPKAREAFDGKGRTVPGEWCRFCRARHQCRALAGMAKAAEEYNDPALMTADEIAEKILPVLPVIKAWCSSMEEYATAEALKGTKFRGYKLVEGRSVRQISNPEKAADALRQAGFSDDQIYRPKDLQTITALEKLAGKKRFAEICGDYIVKPAGRPTLVPESDKRPVYDQAKADFEGITDKDIQ